MQSLSLYQITNAFPVLMEQEEITEKDKKEIEKELLVNNLSDENKELISDYQSQN